ncbi:MAG TPA: hypothetical protein VNS19_15480 [Acidimicrobiales bacterium]|nr:hypothetical protein [Acidimicrobiales bacterium]
MARGRDTAAGEHGDGHRRFDRQFTAGLVAVVALLGIGSYALVQRAHAQEAKRSRPGDACPVRGSDRPGSDSALDGVVAFDRETGAVRWTNVVPYGSELGHRSDELLVVDGAGATERVVAPDTGAVTSCGGVPDDVVLAETGGPRFDLGAITIEAVGDGAHVRALGPDGSELWASDAGNPAAGGRATVESPVHAAALTPDGRTVVVLTGATLEDVD